MNQEVTRQILWNIPVGFVVFLYGMLIPLFAGFIYVGLRWYRIIRLGGATAESRFDQPGRRLFTAFRDGVGQGYVGRESWEWMHYSFLVVFVGLFIGTSIINDGIAGAAGFFGFSYYLVGIMEVL